QAGTAGADATTGLSAFNIAFSTTTDIRYGSTSNVTLHDAYVAGAYYSVTAVVDLDAQLWSLTVAGPGLDDPFVASGLALRDNGITQIDWVSIRALNHGTAIYVDNLAVVPEPAS